MSLFLNTDMFMYNNPFNSFLNGFSSWNNLSFDNSIFNNPWGNFSYGGTVTHSSSKVKSSGGGDCGGNVKQLYNSLGLEKEGLSFEVFAFAMKGYNNLNDKGNGQLGIVDPKSNKYYLIDMKNHKFKGKTDVKFGSGNMNTVANANKQGSHATLSGFTKVSEEYSTSKWTGMGIRFDGLEQGINNNARSKATVIHCTKGNSTWGCIGVTPEYKSGKVDNSATNNKIRRLFPKGTIMFTCPTDAGMNEYKRLSAFV